MCQPGVDVELADASVLDRVDAERMPAEWSSQLQVGTAAEPVFLAIIPPATSVGDLSAIIEFWQQQD